jgi:hypothetical protein
MNSVKGISKSGVIIVVTLLMAVLLFPMKSIAFAWEMDTDRPGRDLKNFWIDKDIETLEALKHCLDSCDKYPECKAFTYVKPGVHGVHGRCYLKNGIPSPVRNTNCISGVVRPETAKDRCHNYAAKAVQQNQSNIDWNCGFSGPRWSSDYQAHHDWCMNVSESSTDLETEERENLLNLCAQISTSGDLSAYDWCYDIDEERGEITFRPVIKNVGAEDWKSKKEGYYKIGVWGPDGIFVEKKYTLYAFPQYYLGSNETETLEGITFPYHPDNVYGIGDIWVVWHPEDTNEDNNLNPGLRENYKGTSFKTDPQIVAKQCSKRH